MASGAHKIDARFMTLLPEVLETTMRTHQKYFSVLNQDGTPAPYFLMVSNMETIDQGGKLSKEMSVFCGHVYRCRIFWVQDQKQSLDAWCEDLAAPIFHEKIGSVSERIGDHKPLHLFVLLEKSPKRLGKTGCFLSKADLLAWAWWENSRTTRF